MIKKNLRANQEYSFWVTNISNRDVSLSDLYLKIPSHRSINLLDKKHFNYTIEQLQKSAASGSIYNKRDKIKTCNNPPEIIIEPGLYLSKEPRYVASRSNVKLEEKTYEELPSLDQLNSEEKFAAEFSSSDSFIPAPISFKKR